MPFLYLHKFDDGIESCFFTEIAENMSPPSSSPIEKDEGETSELTAKLAFEKLPDYLKSCLDYCCVVSRRIFVEKNKLIRLLLAEGLIPEIPGETLENSAANILQQLLCLGMLQLYYTDFITVSELYAKVCLIEVGEKYFTEQAKNSLIYAVVICKGKDLPQNHFDNLLIRSLFVHLLFDGDLQFQYTNVFLKDVCTMPFLAVLNLAGNFQFLPDEVGYLINLRYLGLHRTQVQNLPGTVGNLEKLQTLDISDTDIKQLPEEILKIKQLRHLLMHRGYPWPYEFVVVPKGIGTLVNLQKLTGVHSTPEAATELSKLAQLRELGVGNISEDHTAELFAAVKKMEKLESLWLTAETDYDEMGIRRIGCIPEGEPFAFTTPNHLQQLCIVGGLIEIPNWISICGNLVSLHLYDSGVMENPSTILQYLPELKELTLWKSYKAKLIGKEFCNEGGFPKLEVLSISSSRLVEWSKIVNGAFQNLKCLQFWECYRLRFLPEGLQYITTLEELHFTYLDGDLERRLTGKENYKISHIAKVTGFGSNRHHSFLKR